MQAAFSADFLNGFEETLRLLPGVRRTRVIGPTPPALRPNPVRPVTDTRDSAPVVHVEFDPAILPYEGLLTLFWRSHDPTVATDQPGVTAEGGVEAGARSTVYYYDDDQRIRASMAKIQLDRSGRFGRQTTTRILPAPDDFRNNGRREPVRRALNVDRSFGGAAGGDFAAHPAVFDV